MKDGKPDGIGTFTAKNSEGTKYTYTGEWKNGLWNGKGALYYLSKDYCDQIGTFKEGEFTPTVSEWFVSCGTHSKESFELSDKTIKYLDKNANLFKKKQSGDLISKTKRISISDFSYNKYKEEQHKYDKKS